MNSPHQLLVLSIPPALSDDLVGWLLENESTGGFTSVNVWGHSGDTRRYNITEQVTGRQKRVQFQLAGNIDAIQTLLNQLKQHFIQTGIHYWIIPVLEEGQL
jgi:hypothetical protein